MKRWLVLFLVLVVGLGAYLCTTYISLQQRLGGLQGMTASNNFVNYMLPFHPILNDITTHITGYTIPSSVRGHGVLIDKNGIATALTFRTSAALQEYYNTLSDTDKEHTIIAHKTLIIGTADDVVEYITQQNISAQRGHSWFNIKEFITNMRHKEYRKMVRSKYYITIRPEQMLDILPQKDNDLMRLMLKNNDTIFGAFVTLKDNTLMIQTGPDATTPTDAVLTNTPLFVVSGQSLASLWEGFYTHLEQQNPQAAVIITGLLNGQTERYLGTGKRFKHDVLPYFPGPTAIIVDMIKTDTGISAPALALLIDKTSTDASIINGFVDTIAKRMQAERVTIEMDDGTTREEWRIADSTAEQRTETHNGYDYRIYGDNPQQLIVTETETYIIISTNLSLAQDITISPKGSFVEPNFVMHGEKISQLMEYLYPPEWDVTIDEYSDPLYDNTLVKWISEHIKVIKKQGTSTHITFLDAAQTPAEQ